VGLLGALAVVAWFGLLHPDPAEPLAGRRAVAVFFGLPCVALATAYLAVQLLRRGPVVVVGPEGVWVGIVPGFPAWVRWENLRSLVFVRQYGQRFLFLELADFDAAFGDRGLRRLVRRVVMWPAVPRALGVPQAQVARPLEDLVAALRRWRPDLPPR
jgi:hypothetical protein